MSANTKIEKFSARELLNLRNELLQSGIDSWQAAEVLSGFLTGRGYGVSAPACPQCHHAAWKKWAAISIACRQSWRIWLSSCSSCGAASQPGALATSKLTAFRSIPPRAPIQFMSILQGRVHQLSRTFIQAPRLYGYRRRITFSW